MHFIFVVVLASLVAYFGLEPLKAGAAYRFRGKMMLALEGVAFLAVAVLGALASDLLILGIGALVGIGIRQLPNAQKRLE